MPIYAFACTDCGHQFDRLQKLSDPDPEVCPDCGASAIRRQVTAASFRLAGTGWYETDFKKPGDKKHNLAGDAGKGTDKSDASPSASKDSGGSKKEKSGSKSSASKSPAD